ncbi:MAG: hypothetical protein P8Z35_15670, partial [Ignavibacteriaceae bacterium]
MMLNNLQTILYVIALLLLLNLQIHAENPNAPTNLIIEVARNDKYVIVVDDAHPTFGWVMNDPDKNEFQTAYQILVASSRGNLENENGDMWNSGKVQNNESTNVPYGKNGMKLQSGKMYFWKVRIWDKDGNTSPYSSIGRFIKSLNLSDWTAKPIWDISNKFNE